MSIKTKCFLFASVLFLISAAAIILFSEKVLLKNYLRIESENNHQTILRTEDVISGNITELEKISDDWARWDDTYNFVNDKNQSYVSENLDDKTMQELGLNIMVLFDNKKNIVAYKLYSPNSNEDTILNNNDKKEILAGDAFSFISESENKSGYLELRNKPMVFAASEITPTDQNSARPNGFLVLGRYINDKMVENYSKRYDVPVSIFATTDIKNSSELSTLVDKMNNSKSFYLTDQSNTNTANSYSIFKNNNKDLVFLLEVTNTRDIYQSGRRNVDDLYFFAIPFLLFIAIFAYFRLNYHVINRIISITKTIDNIDIESAHPASLIEDGNDEISHLSRSFNLLLDKMGKCKIWKDKE